MEKGPEGFRESTAARRPQTVDCRLTVVHESTTLRPGDRAPDFSLPTQRGEMRTLADYLANGPLLLAFHRGTW